MIELHWKLEPGSVLPHLTLEFFLKIGPITGQEELMSKQEESEGGRQVVSFPPRRPVKREPIRKAG
jgi:hypothetical protein